MTMFPIDLYCKANDWFLYEGNIAMKRANISQTFKSSLRRFCKRASQIFNVLYIKYLIAMSNWKHEYIYIWLS